MSSEVPSIETPKVEDTSEVNEESASVPARNGCGFVLFIF
jgi:hypothetical protein